MVLELDRFDFAVLVLSADDLVTKRGETLAIKGKVQPEKGQRRFKAEKVPPKQRRSGYAERPPARTILRYVVVGPEKWPVESACKGEALPFRGVLRRSSASTSHRDIPLPGRLRERPG